MSLNILNDTEKIKAVTGIATTLSNLTKTEQEEENFATELGIAVDIIKTISK